MFVKTKKFIFYNGKLKPVAKKLRQNLTAAEQKLWFEYLRGHKYRFVRQKIMGNYILDFYCQKLRLGIEIDGETHIGDRNEKYDKKRTEELKNLGIEILRFWNDDVLSGIEIISEIIEKEIKRIIKIKSSQPLYTKGAS